MKRFLRIGATTFIVGIGISFALFFAAGIFTFFGEANPGLFLTLSIASIAVGMMAALFWALRRIRGTPVRIPEWVLLVFAVISLSGLAQHLISEEVHGFLAFDPLVAAQRDARINNIIADNLSFLGTTSMGVRVYSVERDRKPYWVIGVAPTPCFGLWWTYSFEMGENDYENCMRRGILDKPQR